MKPGIPVYQLLRNSFTITGIRFIFILVVLCLIQNSLHAQNKPIHGLVVSRISGQQISFASVSWKKSGNGCVTDSNGVFVIYSRYKDDTLVVSHVGFDVSILPVHMSRENDSLIVVMAEKRSDEVVVNMKYNRGLVWWKKIVQHKSKNDPRQFRNFSCNLYRKMEMDLTNITPDAFMKVKLLKPFQFLSKYVDSVSDGKSFLPVFMKETISKYWLRTNPEEKKEQIEAFKTSGLKNEVVLHFMDGLKQEIDVYDNSIMLFGKEFISPLSDDASGYYNYKAADTQYINGRRFLHLFFNPKTAGENNFSGDCWIDYGTWAVSDIQLEVSTTANINYVNQLQIKQKFERTVNNTWIFSKNQFVAEIAPLSKNKIAFIVRQTSVYQHVEIQADNVNFLFPAGDIRDEVVLDDSAKNRDEGYWDQNRPEPLTPNEKNVYLMMDTLNNMSLFKKYRETADFILSGRKQIGKIEIGPWYKWISTNQMEKVRLRFDLATSEHFSKMTYIHGYIAYGIRDNQFNGGLDFHHKFHGDGGYSFQAYYLHDLNNGGTDKGGMGLTQDNMFSQLIRKPGVPQKYYHVDEFLVDFGKEWPNKFSAHVFLKRGSYETYAPLPPQKDLSNNQQDIFNTEAGISFRYAPSERKICTYRKDYRYNGNQPILEFTWAHGIPGVFGSMYQYNRISAQVSQKFRIPRWGQIDYCVYGGRIMGEALPFMLLEVHPGNDIFYYSKQSFNLMNRFEYLSDRFAGIFLEHDFERKLINLVPFLRKINIRQFWNLKAVWGSLSASNKILNCREYSGYAMKSLNGRPYIEIGTGLDNIFRYFRVDCIWRLSPSAPGPVSLSGNYQTPAAHFGVFGSFHIQF